MTCLANEAVSFKPANTAVKDKLKELGYELVLADWTDRRNWVIADTVTAYGRDSIPLYLIIPGKKDRPAIQLEAAVTPGTFIKALEAGARS